jgi:soluble lytic murein transglycosylase-like protein
MQVIGQVAREFGFTGKYLSELCDPAVGIEYGCRKLAKCFEKAKGAVDVVSHALLAYNGGGDHEYPTRVLKRLPKYKEPVDLATGKIMED